VMILAAVLGLLLIYVCGLWQFGFVTGLGIAEVLLTVCLPCLPGEVLKLILDVVLVGSLERRGFVF